MVDVVFAAGRLLVALVLVVLNGFFVAAEFALVRVRSTSVDQLVDEGRPGAETLQGAMGSLDDYLAVTQLGITLASLGLGWAGEPAVASLLEPALGPVLPPDILHLVSFALGFGFITFLHVVFGELAPKTIAIARAERIALLVAPPLKLFYYVFYPGLVVFNGTANAFTSLIGIPPASETDETLEEREIRMVLSRAGDEGNVDAREVEMIERVFDLDDTVVREVMVPRPDVVAVPADATLSAIRSTALSAEHTRYPVVDADDADQIVGFVDLKDVLRAGESETAADTTAADIARDVLVVPETMPIDDLLLQFRDERQQMAAVVDEWGSLEGIATVEDVVEAVVGDIRDEFDTDEREASIRRRADGGYEIDGGVPLRTVNDALGTSFHTDEFETLAGLVLDRLDRVPEMGDSLDVDGHVVEVTAMDDSRIETVTIRSTSSPAEGGE
ncbi:hemolysin family protein [Halobaculum magnesiiphilum]|uniref:Hemolysin family protein n=1 Tax=Halobaculum magnesiiphilum TaxID=1017351 RepID=A0A8T8WIG4_9EURY|nr:hemolysin family protein [Halobaculum magnesiiphilum]QZP39651.1 hemolysin family protein [Halobaculum magnesiiphilum]